MSSERVTTADLRAGDVVATQPDTWRRAGGVQRASDVTLDNITWRTINELSAVTASIRRVFFTDCTDTTIWLDAVWHRQVSEAIEDDPEWLAGYRGEEPPDPYESTRALPGSRHPAVSADDWNAGYRGD